MALQRSIGLWGLTFIGIGGVLGSGWLFAPMLAAQQAGPASLVAWAIGLLAVLLVALCFAEVAGSLPEAGAIARLPYYSHGSLAAAVIGWSAWLGYATLAPIETIAILKYLAPLVPSLMTPGGDAELSLLGQLAAIAILLVLTVINAFGVAWLERANTAVTLVKIAIPVGLALVFLANVFEPANFTAGGGFAPQGLSGILAAVSAGGIVFSFVGFRHTIDLAGEARDPQRTVPLALLLSVAACFVVYLLLQVAFIGGLPPDALAHGWPALDFGHHLGPLAGIAATAGLGWLVSALYAGAVLGPFGAALIATGSNARLGLALARNGFFPPLFDRLSARGVPLSLLLLGTAAGCLMVLTLPFGQMVALNSASVVLSFCIGPLALAALRRQLPALHRPVRLPAAGLLAPAAFVVAGLCIYWCGFDTIWRLDLAVVAGLALFLLRRLRKPEEGVHWQGGRWLLAYLTGLTLLSWLGSFGGRGLLPFGWDLLAVSLLSLLCYRLGLRDALSPERTQAYLAAATARP